MTLAFEYKDIVRTFHGFQLGPLNMTLEPGTALGFIGPNGSGKTTTIQCLVGLLRPDSGDVEVFGRRNDLNRPEWKLDIGYVGDIHVFYERWTGERNLRFLSQFYPDWSHKRVSELARRFQLPLEKRAKDLSTGNRVKLSLVAALAHAPRLLLLDEPTSGVDPLIRKEILDVLFEVLETGERSIFYATHILPEISRLVDDLVFIDNGSVWMRTSKEDLLDKWRKLTFKADGIQRKLSGIMEHQWEGKNHVMITSDFDRTIEELRSIGVENIAEIRMSVDEIAIQILKGRSHVAGA
ncbi:ABC transporter ATP-binding protein [Acidobacteriota bacterium]